MPTPDLHLLKDMGHSPGGTLFPWHPVKGFMALREDKKWKEHYGEEYEKAEFKKEEAIDRWKKRNPIRYWQMTLFLFIGPDPPI